MSWETLEKVAKFLADPMGCEELEKKSSGQGSGHNSLDLHYPTHGVGDAYDSNHSFWDRRKQDYCNMPAALSWIQTGSLGVRGLPQMTRGVNKGIPAWLQHWLGRPKPRPKLRAEEGIRGDGEVRYVIYDEHTFVSSVTFRSKQPISPEQCKPRLDEVLGDLEKLRSPSGSVMFRPPTVIELD